MILYVVLILHFVQVCYCWPGGKYGLPMPQHGCPHASYFDWKSGTRSQITEMGSRASQSNHLAGMHPYATDTIQQSFCMKDVEESDGTEWQPGQYCIYKAPGYPCPASFGEGMIHWDDNAPMLGGDHRQTTTGSLPDGRYTSNTEIKYCCRKDGYTMEKIKLPTEYPFFLLKWGTENCQQVENARSQEEWVYWRDVSSMNIGVSRRPHPTMQRTKHQLASTKLFYCFYEPESSGHGLRILMIVGYVILGILVFAFLFMVGSAISQKLWHVHKKMTHRNSAAPEADAQVTLNAPVSSNGEQVCTVVLPPSYAEATGDADVPDGDAEKGPFLGPEAANLPSYDDVISEDGKA